MKQVIFLALAMSTFTSVFSQTTPQTPDPDSLSPAVRAVSLTQSMTCELGLSTGQATKIEAINLEACKKMDEVASTAGNNNKLLNKEEEEVERIWFGKLQDAMEHKQWVTFEKISNGDERTLKMTSVCRKPSQDGYSGF